MNLEGAMGYLVGEPHKGMKGMFVMMNHARLGVGLEELRSQKLPTKRRLPFAAIGGRDDLSTPRGTTPAPKRIIFWFTQMFVVSSSTFVQALRA